MSQIDISKTFSEHFEVIPALSDELIKETFRIRYQVYCEDLNYESERESKCESDEYDTNALHLLIRSTKLNKFIGCTRLIRRSPDNPQESLPFEKACSNTLNYSKIESLLHQNNIAEVSRLAVTSDFRRRKGEKDKAINISDDDYGTLQHKHFRFPYVPLGLFYGTIELAAVNHIDILFMLTEKRLASHFSKLGADLQYIGEPIEFHGIRVPSMVSTTQIIRDIRPLVRPLYQIISKSIHENLASSNISHTHTINIIPESKSISFQLGV